MTPIPSRRLLLSAGPALLLAACQGESPSPPVTGATAPRPPAAATPGVAVVYVGAPDCVWCRSWHAGYYSTWQASPERRQVAFLERSVPMLMLIGTASAWPEDVRWILAEMRARQMRVSAPTFAVIEGNQLIAAGSGMYAWDATIMPRLRERLART